MLKIIFILLYNSYNETQKNNILGGGVYMYGNWMEDMPIVVKEDENIKK